MVDRIRELREASRNIKRNFTGQDNAGTPRAAAATDVMTLMGFVDDLLESLQDGSDEMLKAAMTPILDTVAMVYHQSTGRPHDELMKEPELIEMATIVAKAVLVEALKVEP